MGLQSKGWIIVMKKILSLVLALVMLASVSAFAEYSLTEYTYDESLFADVGGDWLAFEDFGVMFYLPDVFEALEVSAEEAEQGVVANFATSDLSGVLSIAYGPAVDLEGNAIGFADGLADFYASLGMSNVDVVMINGLPVVSFTMPDMDMLSYCLFFNDSTQVVFSFAPASSSNLALLAGLTMSSLQPVA